MGHSPSWRMSELKRALKVISSSALVLQTRKWTWLNCSGRTNTAPTCPNSQSAKPTGAASVGRLPSWEPCPVLSILQCFAGALWSLLGSWGSSDLSLYHLLSATHLTALCPSLSFFICKMETDIRVNSSQSCYQD